MALIAQKHFGYEIRVDEEGGLKVARVLRNGELVHKEASDHVSDAFEWAWCWACVNRPDAVRLVSTLIEHQVEHEDPWGARRVVYSSVVKAVAEEAVVALGRLLADQYNEEQQEHLRRRDQLAAEMEEVAAAIQEVEAKIEPLKALKGTLTTRMRDLPGLVYRPKVELNALEELPLVMERRKAGERFDAPMTPTPPPTPPPPTPPRLRVAERDLDSELAEAAEEVVGKRTPKKKKNKTKTE